MAWRHTDLGSGCWFAYAPEWLDRDRADALFTELRATEPWQQLPIKVFGRDVMQPRLMAWGGEIPYRYSGLELASRPMPEPLSALCDAVSREVGVALNHVVLNLYRDGRDHVSFHADNEPELGRDPLVATVSLGVRRRFVLKPKRKRRTRKNLGLAHGSLLVMGGRCQHRWRHAIPKQPDVRGERISLTFRRLLGPPGWRAWSADV